MFRSFKLGRVAGIDLKMHPTFLIFALLGLFDPLLWLEIPIVFGIVVLHELGHALTARRLGIATRDILLTPIGGIASLTRMPSRPLDEVLITAAGPAVNVVLALAAWLALPFTAGTAQVLLGYFLVTNVALAAFNLLPAFPMDGGRLLRAFLTMKTGDYAGSTRTAARVGRFLAWAIGLVGLIYNPMLCLIAVFVWFAATAEEASVNGGLLGSLLQAAARARQAATPPSEPDILFVRPLARRRPNIVVDAEFTRI